MKQHVSKRMSACALVTSVQKYCAHLFIADGLVFGGEGRSRVSVPTSMAISFMWALSMVMGVWDLLCCPPSVLAICISFCRAPFMSMGVEDLVCSPPFAVIGVGQFVCSPPSGVFSVCEIVCCPPSGGINFCDSLCCPPSRVFGMRKSVCCPLSMVSAFVDCFRGEASVASLCMER